MLKSVQYTSMLLLLMSVHQLALSPNLHSAVKIHNIRSMIGQDIVDRATEFDVVMIG